MAMAVREFTRQHKGGRTVCWCFPPQQTVNTTDREVSTAWSTGCGEVVVVVVTTPRKSVTTITTGVTSGGGGKGVAVCQGGAGTAATQQARRG